MFILEPHFEFDKPVFHGKSAFASQYHLPDNVCFPKRLEYGEIDEVSIISWLSVLYALNGRKVAIWILFRYEKVKI